MTDRAAHLTRRLRLRIHLVVAALTRRGRVRADLACADAARATPQGHLGSQQVRQPLDTVNPPERIDDIARLG